MPKESDVVLPSDPAPASAGPRAFRIFVSSPGDLGEERLICARVIEAMKPEFARAALLQAILWEQEPLTADAGFQDQILLPSQTDIVVILIWSRLGYRLHSKFKQEGDAEAPTGTIFEFRDALDARRRNPAKTPDMMVYRKTAEPPKPSITDREAMLKTMDDYQRVEDFFNSAFFKDAENEGAFTGAFHTFKRGTDFAENFERHLRAMILRRLGEQARDRSGQWTGGSPFRGLQAFDFEHRALFAGRTRAAMEVREALRRQAAAGRAFVLVMGMSGGGKSSLARAGVLPDLVQPGVIEGVALWRRVVFRPGEAGGDLCRGLVTALMAGDAGAGVGLPELADDDNTPESVTKRLCESPAAAAVLVEGALRHAADAERVTQRERLEVRRRETDAKGQFDEVAHIDQTLKDLKPPKARLALVVDQMEELFTDPRVNDEQRASFVALLGALARAGRTWVLATLRSDFFARCELIPELVALKEGEGTYHLLAPNEAEISQMIRHPARAAGLDYEKDPRTGESLADALLVAATRQAGSLPLLQFTLDELYQRSEKAARPVLSLADYRALGGLEGAVARRAEEAFTAFAATDGRAEAALPLVFANLVRVGADGRGGVSAPAPAERFEAIPGGPELVAALTAARLLVADGGSVRVAHEALLSHWPRLQEWIARNGEFLVARARVAAAASRWEGENRSDDLLLPPGKPLVEAEEILASRRSDLSPAEAAFVEASSAHRRAEERAAAARRKKVLAAISAAALVAVAFAVLSFFQSRRAEAAARRATFARGEAEKLIDFMGVDLRDKLTPIGRLELLDDANKRVRAYYEAFAAEAASDPDIRARQAVALTNQGEIARNQGRLAEAMKSYRDAESIQRALVGLDPNSAPRGAALAFMEERIGFTLKAQGKLDEALAAQRSALARRQTLLAREPNDPRRAQDVATSHTAIGELLDDRGDLPGALAAFEAALKIDRDRAGRPGATPGDRHNLHSSLLIVGRTQLKQNAPAPALAHFREAIVIVRALIQADPKNLPWQSNLAVALEQEADALAATGDAPGSLRLLREAAVIHRRLAAYDPTNALWQGNVFVSYAKIGDALLNAGDAPGALREAADALAFQQKLVDLDPENVEWARFYAVAHQRVGEALLAQKDHVGALKSFQNALDLARRLLAKSPDHAEIAGDVFASLTLVGDAQRATGDNAAALGTYRAALEALRPLLVQNATDAKWLRSGAETEDKVAQLLEARGEFAEALGLYRRALGTYEKQFAENAADPSLGVSVAWVAFHLGRAQLAAAPPDPAGARAQWSRAQAALDVVKKSGAPLPKESAEQAAEIEAGIKKLSPP